MTRPAFCIPQPSSSIPHSAPRIPQSRIPHDLPFTPHRLSSSLIAHPASLIPHPSSRILHPTSRIPHHTCSHLHSYLQVPSSDRRGSVVHPPRSNASYRARFTHRSSAQTVRAVTRDCRFVFCFLACRWAMGVWLDAGWRVRVCVGSFMHTYGHAG